MSKHQIRAFDYVNKPYEPVRDAIRKDAAAIFHRATKVAESRGEAIVASLTVEVGGVQLTKDVTIEVGDMKEEAGRTELNRVARVSVRWRASESPGLFPEMEAELSVYPLSFTETQVELVGHYEPPFGLLGSAIDAVAGQRIAEASVHRFVQEVAERLRKDLA